MNRKKKKLLYIRMKNSWLRCIDKDKMVYITTSYTHYPHNPKYPLNQIVMDFKKREEIHKYGVLNVKI